MFHTIKRWLGLDRRLPGPPAAPAFARRDEEVSDAEVIAAILGVPVHLMFTLAKDVLFTRVSNSAVAATTSIDSSRVDMTGFDSVCFIWLLGDITTGCVLQAVAKSNAADSTSSSTSEKSGTSITAGATDYDNKMLIVDLHRPTLRYAYSSLARGTANAVVDGCIAIQYNSHARAVTQSSTVGDAVVGGPNA